MQKRDSKSAGYTRLEIAFMLVLVILVGLLAVTKYLELSEDAEQAMEPGLIEGVRKGIASYAEEARDRGSSQLYPNVLDDAESGPVTARDPYFGRVLDRGVAVAGWSKLATNRYRTPSGKSVEYNPDTGELLISAVEMAPLPNKP
ncbi:MAG: hypothetical protein KDI47_09680 [Gammaproteobacteria bacterium]|nr:hypothetical protein [Gammaproteobacteria bacterium]